VSRIDALSRQQRDDKNELLERMDVLADRIGQLEQPDT
jgi:hypothetical protein